MIPASSSASDSEIGRLAAEVIADPLDLAALRKLGLAWEKQGSAPLARRALATASRGFAAQGQLAMAIVAVKELHRLDVREGAQLLVELAAAFGKGSPRVDPSFRPRPPAKVGRPPRSTPPLDVTDVLPLAEAAVAKIPEQPLPAVPLFAGLSSSVFTRLVHLARIEERAAGDVVVEVGAPGDGFFIVARGAVRIARPVGDEEIVLSHLRAGSFFGEMALLTDSPRTARATCEAPTVLLAISRDGVDQLARAEAELGQVLADYTRDRLLRNLMLTSAVFAPLSDEARARLVRSFKLRTLKAGSALLVEGEPSAFLYVILAGQLDVEKRDGKEALHVARLGPGDVVGEISLLTRRPATATVRAAEKALVLALARDDFNAIVAEFPDILAHVYQLANARERDLERFAAESVVEADEYLI